jgi:hypothetical protein
MWRTVEKPTERLHLLIKRTPRGQPVRFKHGITTYEVISWRCMRWSGPHGVFIRDVETGEQKNFSALTLVEPVEVW